MLSKFMLHTEICIIKVLFVTCIRGIQSTRHIMTKSFLRKEGVTWQHMRNVLFEFLSMHELT